MKIKNINKETKNTNKKNLLPIAKAGLSLGLTVALMKVGVINYDSMINWESMSDVINNINIGKLPVDDVNKIFDLTKTVVTYFGMNTIMLASKELGLAKEVIKPIAESEKLQSNPKLLHIKESLKGKNKAKESKQPKALVALARNGLVLGFKAYMIASGQLQDS